MEVKTNFFIFRPRNFIFGILLDVSEIGLFGKENVSFDKYKTKGIEWGAYDLQIIIDTLNDPGVRAMITAGNFFVLLYKLVNILFERSRRKIEDNNTRPKYTILTIRVEKKFINITNANKDNKLMISETSTAFKMKEEEYSDEKLKEYFD